MSKNKSNKYKIQKYNMETSALKLEWNSDYKIYFSMALWSKMKRHQFQQQKKTLNSVVPILHKLHQHI